MKPIGQWGKLCRAGIALLPWIASSCAILSLKFYLLAQDVTLGVAPMLYSARISEIRIAISLFRADLLVQFLLAPILLLLLLYFVPFSWRTSAIGILAALAALCTTVELVVYRATGALPPAKLIWIALKWAIHSHDTSILALPPQDVILITGNTLLAAPLTLLAIRSQRIKESQWIGLVSISVCGAGAILGIMLCFVTAPQTPWNAALLFRTVSAAVYQDRTDSTMLAMSPVNLLRLYHDTAHAPSAEVSKYFGSAREFNVLLVVLEALPAQIVDPAHDALADMPNLRTLRRHSFVSERHYTTFPLTNYATFSIFTSLYTKSAMGSSIGNRNVRLPGMIRDLDAEGYHTAFYGYVWKSSSQRDDVMLRQLGFGKICEPFMDGQDHEGRETFGGPIDRVEAHDLQVLHSLKDDIRLWSRKHEKFAAAFFPEIGHDPYRALNPNGSSTQFERGRLLAELQDRWLGELVEVLKDEGELERTIIVVTSDHGLRLMTTGNPITPTCLISHGKLEDIVMRVPLVIYVPQVLDHTTIISTPTSHIDISPSILDLLGISTGREYEEGSTLWNPDIASRRLYLSMDTFGASGYFEDGLYSMVSGSGEVLTSRTLQFEEHARLPFDSNEAGRVRQSIKQQDSLQRSLLFQMLDSSNAPTPAGTRP